MTITYGSLSSSYASNFDPFRYWRLQSPAQVRNQPRIVDLAKGCRILFELGDRFVDLCLRPIAVSAAQVVHPDGSLNQTLVEQPQRSPGRPPQIFPRFMGLEKTPGVEKNYSGPEEVSHGTDPLSY
jgi:hypothetical protein